MFEICKGIREEQLEDYNAEVNSFRMGAMDIACGYHSYLFAIARWQLQVSNYIHICCNLPGRPGAFPLRGRLYSGHSHTFNKCVSNQINV